MKEIFDVNGQTVCIAGASRGLGKGVAKAFAERGANVVISSWDKAELEETREEFAAEDLDIQTIVADVTNRTDCIHLIEKTINLFGRLDTLICNAGTDIIKPAEQYEEDEWDKVLNTNLRGYYYCAQFAAKEMLKEKKGCIIMTSSIAGELGIPGLTPYAASKGGINQLVRTMAVEWAKEGIRVNAIAPGYIENTMKDVSFDENDPYQKRVITFTPMGRRGSIDEFIGAYIFLASPSASYITGEVLYVDGGYHAC